MLAWLLAPTASLASNGFARPWLVLDQGWQDLLGWFVPFLAGRIYLADDPGRRDLAAAIVISGLACIPIAAFETTLGPRYYLSGLIYGTQPAGAEALRLGGWRRKDSSAAGSTWRHSWR